MPTVDKKALGIRLASRRAELGISAAELASRVGMKQQGIASIEAGAVERPRKLLELARELQTTDEWLLYGTEPAGGALTPEFFEMLRSASGQMAETFAGHGIAQEWLELLDEAARKRGIHRRPPGAGDLGQEDAATTSPERHPQRRKKR